MQLGQIMLNKLYIVKIRNAIYLGITSLKKKNMVEEIMYNRRGLKMLIHDVAKEEEINKSERSNKKVMLNYSTPKETHNKGTKQLIEVTVGSW